MNRWGFSGLTKNVLISDMKMPGIVIGIVGEMASGKETTSGYFEEFIKPNSTILRLTFSTPLVEILEKEGKVASRANLIELIVRLKKEKGDDVLSDLVFERATRDFYGYVVMDGIRWPSDMKMFEKFPKKYLVYVTADMNLRYERAVKRKQKAGEDSMTLEQFEQDHKKPTEIYIPDFGKKADFTIVNNGSFEDLHSEVKRVYDEIVSK